MRHPRSRKTIGVLAALAILSTASVAIAASSNGANTIRGQVRVAGQPEAGWRVELYGAGPGGAVLLDSALSNARGKFRLRPKRGPGSVVLYILAKRGPRDRMLAIVGPPGEVPDKVVVNEHATVASVWTSAQFLDGDEIRGNRVGLVAAARNVPNLVDLENGGLSALIQKDPNGGRTTTLAAFNTLASLLADCLTDGCREFFRRATPRGEPPAADTLQALHYVALNPWHNVTAIFALRPPAIDGADDNPVFIPTLVWPPTAWTLSLVYTEGGFNAPGGMSIDAEGNLWTNNNFIPGSQSDLADVGGVLVPNPLGYAGTGVTKLTSYGMPLSPPTGFLGGGTYGAAFGVAIDHRGHVFIGNFGGDSLTELAPDGTPISPDSSSPYGSDGGYRSRRFNDPQSVIVDHEGNIWVSNINGNTVSQLIGGDPTNIRTWGGRRCPIGFNKPWGLASDHRGRIWVTNFTNNSVSVIDPRGPRPYCPSREFSLGLPLPPREPEGVAVDMDGNVWVAGTGGATVTLLEAARGFERPRNFDADGALVGPWGIAVDGYNNVWVADFFGKRLHNLCGTSANCPLGKRRPGDPISPTGRGDSGEPGNGGGYGVNGALQSITSVVIDQAGNVWVANNFDNVEVCLLGAAIPPPGEGSTVGEERLQPMCGGNGAVVIFGIAGPVAAPLIGPPVHP